MEDTVKSREEIVAELNAELNRKILTGEMKGSSSLDTFEGPTGETYVLASQVNQMFEEFKTLISRFFVDKIMDYEERLVAERENGYDKGYDERYIQRGKNDD